ncbi:MAG: hypothetical protein WCF65_08120 [Parachlamydiaceae bacterium]
MNFSYLDNFTSDSIPALPSFSKLVNSTKTLRFISSFCNVASLFVQRQWSGKAVVLSQTDHDPNGFKPLLDKVRRLTSFKEWEKNHGVKPVREVIVGFSTENSEKIFIKALIGLFQKGLGSKKAERLDISDKTFGNVPKRGIEPPTFALRMRGNP